MKHLRDTFSVKHIKTDQFERKYFIALCAYIVHCLLHPFMGQNGGVGGLLLVSIIHDIIAKQTAGRRLHRYNQHEMGFSDYCCPVIVCGDLIGTEISIDIVK